MPVEPVVLCAVDFGPLTGRVVYHAVGFARVMNLPIKVLYVAKHLSPTIESEVADACMKAVPYGMPVDDLDVLVRTGDPAEVLCREAAAHQAALMVMGTSTHGALVKLLLGSTCASVLAQVQVPVLLVPPTRMDIVTFSDRVALSCGGVMAAVDLVEDNVKQVNMASRIAALGHHPFSVMTIAHERDTDHDAAERLRVCADQATPLKPVLTFVRRGDVAEQISQCAGLEGAGLVVMGLRDRRLGQPGRIAASVLKTGEAFVLVVPN